MIVHVLQMHSTSESLCSGSRISDIDGGADHSNLEEDLAEMGLTWREDTEQTQDRA